MIDKIAAGCGVVTCVLVAVWSGPLMQRPSLIALAVLGLLMTGLIVAHPWSWAHPAKLFSLATAIYAVPISIDFAVRLQSNNVLDVAGYFRTYSVSEVWYALLSSFLSVLGASLGLWLATRKQGVQVASPELQSAPDDRLPSASARLFICVGTLGLVVLAAVPTVLGAASSLDRVARLSSTPITAD